MAFDFGWLFSSGTSTVGYYNNGGTNVRFASHTTAFKEAPLSPKARNRKNLEALRERELTRLHRKVR